MLAVGWRPIGPCVLDHDPDCDLDGHSLVRNLTARSQRATSRGGPCICPRAQPRSHRWHGAWWQEFSRRSVVRPWTLTERSHIEQSHQANICLINGQPGGVELDRVRSPAQILGQMTADPVHQVAGLKI